MLKNFQRHTEREIVLHCLPEGAVGVYPPHVWKSMRGLDQDKEVSAANSLVFRRSLRRFGAMSLGSSISNQGRITIPSTYRVFAELVPSSPVIVIGCEIGVEIWNQKRWIAEAELIQRHVFEKGEHEMNSDVSGVQCE